MKAITTLSLLLIGVFSFAQSTSMTIFNNSGQQFFVIMNGIRQNSLPQTNVKIGGMSPGAYEVKLIFADGKTGDINKKLFIDAPGDYLARVVLKGKKRKLQYLGMADGTQTVPTGGSAIEYRQNDQSVYSDQTSVNGNTQSSEQHYKESQSQPVQTQTSVQVQTPPNSGKVDLQLSKANTSVIMPADPNYGEGGTSISNTTGQQSTTFGSSATIPDPNIPTGFGIRVDINTQNAGTPGTPATIQDPVTGGTVNTSTATPSQSANPVESTDVYTCTLVLTNENAFVTAMNKETFDADKRAMIERELQTYCLTADQAYVIIKALTFDADRIDMCKFLYVRMSDKVNGKRLLELLTFDADKKEFNNFMATN